MTVASARPEADYSRLTPEAQAAFTQAMERADHAGTNDTYRQAMTDACILAGLPIPASVNIARCSCWTDAGGCGCGAIFDTHLPGVVVTATNGPDLNLSELQCPTCGHDHPRPIAD
ncbi:hypothetical protein [Streptomyces sp. NPDC004783]|uniref:hypothetical protein n=1 Tax=Streptomyces sp. NPDC004783 TaxID=3154459 RepID=UPI0033AD56B2